MSNADEQYDEYQPMPSSDAAKISADFSKWRLDAETLFIELEHDLKGETWAVNKEGQGEWIKSGIEIMSDRAAKCVVSIMRMLINKNTFLTNLKEDEIMIVCRSVMTAFANHLAYNWEEWGVEKEHLDMLATQIGEFLFMALKRAQNEGERLSLARSEQVIRRYDEGVAHQQKYMLPHLFGRKKGGEE